MTHPRARTAALLVASALFLAGVATASAWGADSDWPSFRGTRASGVADGHAIPSRWNADKGENILWKTPIPGLGFSSPVIWGDRVFLTSAISGKDDPELRVGLYGEIAPVEDETPHKFQVIALDKNSGKILWTRTAHEGVPKIKRHTKASHANSSVATDGKHVVAFFGSEGLYCYDMDGKLLWKKDLGLLDSGFFRVPTAQWGFGSSPIIHEGRVIVQCDVQKDSFLAMFDIKDGKEIWRTARDEAPGWGTPTIVEHEGKARIAVNGWKHIGGYDFESGKEIWKMKGLGDIPVPTPVTGHGLIFITNAHGDGAPIYAIKQNAQGDISLEEDQTSNEHIAWSKLRSGGYMQTPLVYGDNLYVCRDNGVISTYVAKTGERLWQARLGGGSSGFTASIVAGDGKIFVTSEMGDITVLEAGNEKKELAKNELGEITMASPAISEGVLFFRTVKHLVAVGATKTEAK